MYAKSSNDGNNENSSIFRILGLRDDRCTVARACHFSLDNRVGSGLLRMLAQIHAFTNIRKRKETKKEKEWKDDPFAYANITASISCVEYFRHFSALYAFRGVFEPSNFSSHA